MGNIQGGPFELWVTNQIKERQLSLGRGSGGNPQDLLYQQSKTPYLRLASSVNLKSTPGIDIVDRLNKLPDFDANNLIGSNLAEQFILQGGAVSLINNNPFVNLKSDDVRLNSGLNTKSLTPERGNQGELFGAYGWGGTTERGFVPMPGITGASVKYENNGALTKTTINIKCYSRTQLALVDALYMRPGYTVLLEFGWSTYLKTNDGDDLLVSPIKKDDVSPVKLVNTEPFKTGPLRALLDGKSNQYDIVRKIKDEREIQSGNYEAVFGKIVNFKWSLNNDGSYDCEVHLRGLGEVIESLKVNTNTSSAEGKVKIQEEKGSTEDDPEEEDKKLNLIPLVANAQKSTLNKILFAIYQDAKEKTGFKAFGEGATGEGSPDESRTERFIREKIEKLLVGTGKLSGKYLNIALDTPGEDSITPYQIVDFPYISNNGQYTKRTVTIPKGILALTRTTTGTDNYSPQVYITFGLLTALLQKNVVLRNGQNGAPLFMFDMNFDNLSRDTNLMRRMPGQFSCNPLKFLIPSTPHSLDTTKVKENMKIDGVLPENIGQFPDYESSDKLKSYNQFLKDHGVQNMWEFDTYLGRLANVYVNVNYIATTLEETEVKSNDVQRSEKNGLDFLNKILADMNISLGGINSMKMIVPNDGGIVKFTENIPQQFTNTFFDRKDYCKFNTSGFNYSKPPNTEAGSLLNNQDQGSIVRNINIDASIPSNFSSMISIGSQANGNQAAGNATSFSNYNTGLIDRIIPKKVITNVKTKDPTTEESEAPKTQRDFMKEIIEDLTTSNWLAEQTKGSKYGLDASGGVHRDIVLEREWYGDDLEAFEEIAGTYHQYLSGILSQPASSGGAGLMKVPFFLPFNLSLEMDGISGIVMMERFEIDQKVLPPSYDPDSVEIIVKTVDHEISVNAWTTTLGTQSVPINKTSSTPSGKKGTIDPTTNPTDSTVSDVVEEEPPINPDPDIDANPLLRLRLTRLYDDGNQILGILDVLAEDETTVRFSLPTVEQSFKDNQNRLSCVPKDRYLMGVSNGGGYGPHFQLYSNSKNNYSPQELKDGDGSNIRTDIFIIPRWNYSQLQGSIGVGLTYNTLTNQAVNSNETGLGPSVNSSKAAAPSADALNQINLQLGNLKEFFLDIEGTPSRDKDSFINVAKSYYFWENPDISGPDFSGGEELPSNYA